MVPTSEITDPISATIQSWVDRELAPWRGQNLVRTQLERQLYNFCRRAPTLRLYRFASGTVAMQPRIEQGPPNFAQEDRAQHYLTFFRGVAGLLPRGFNAMICISVHDKVMGPKLPVFGLQRAAGENWLLMPDIDFLINKFHEEAQFKDTLSYAGKIPRAVFAGATSGGMHTVERVLAAESPRLRAAVFFDGRLDVDFRLPSIVQCLDEDARSLLAAQPYCQRPVLPWAEQFRSRFLISMDGNGATCSRVVVALASNAVLLKYRSDDMLYYFDGLVPHVHYVPIARDEDVLAVLAAERLEPGRYLPVAEAGQAFAAQYLTRERVSEYMARLLIGYAAMLREGDADQPRKLPRRVVAAARQEDGTAYLSETHDWVGIPGSGVALTSFKLLCQPKTEIPRLYYQASMQGGGFTPTIVEGAWCGEGPKLTGLRVENPRESELLDIAIEAHFIDGTTASASQMGMECRADSGAPIEAFRVRLL